MIFRQAVPSRLPRKCKNCKLSCMNKVVVGGGGGGGGGGVGVGGGVR